MDRQPKSPLKAIKVNCLECMGMSQTHEKPKVPYDDVKKCTAPNCPLYYFRQGKNPYLSGKKTGGNIESLKKAREAQKLSRKSLSES